MSRSMVEHDLALNLILKKRPLSGQKASVAEHRIVPNLILKLTGKKSYLVGQLQKIGSSF